MHADRFADQGRRGGTVNIASLKLDHRISPDFIVFCGCIERVGAGLFSGEDHYYDMRG
jgi:hypothetical protein